MSRPNVVFVFGDQWRAQSTGYAGNSVVQTPNLDRLAKQSLNFTHAVSSCPVCSPARASLLTGQNPLSHGVFVNDVPLDHQSMSIGQSFKQGGYKTAYIGKWHVNGNGRSNYIPPDQRLGFDHWQVLECTHNYNQSAYYDGSSDQKLYWDDYDAFAQTNSAIDYISTNINTKNDSNTPFFLMLSWGPPHAPYQTAPEPYQDMYKPEEVLLRPNVPESLAEQARQDLSGYYAHCTALDDCLGRLLDQIDQSGQTENTIFVFTSDHGDMLGSQGLIKKQKPWDESIRIPCLIRYPELVSRNDSELVGREISDVLMDTPDFMPTLLGLVGLPIPETVEGVDYSMYLRNPESDNPSDSAAVLACYHAFGQWRYGLDGGPNHLTGREFRGLRTRRYTYVTTLDGPWLLYDNLNDPYQQNNLLSTEMSQEVVQLAESLNRKLEQKLDKRKDNFLSGMDYIRQWGYTVDERGTIPYTN